MNISPKDFAASKMKLILNNMERLDQMIVELLDASRLEAGQSMQVQVKLCDLDRIVRQVIDDVSLSHPDCFKVLTQGKCEGYWDENGLRRIVENLLWNAIKYRDEHTFISISLSQDQNSIELSVQNFGEIITAKDVPILFQQYRKLISSQGKAGWGLGLTMIKGMVDAHKGEIMVESNKEKGTTFTIKLPKDARASIESRVPHQVNLPNHIRDIPQVPKNQNPH